MTITRKRLGLSAGTAVAALIALGLLGPVSPATADEADDLAAVCAGKPGSETNGITGTCTFESESVVSSYLDWHRYGDPVTNCKPGTTQPAKSTVGDVRTSSQTWSVGGGIGLEIEGVIKIEGKGEYSQTESQSSERRDEITALPGQKMAVTLGQGYEDVQGRIRVDVDVYDNSGNDGGIYLGTEAHYIDNVIRKAPTGYQEVGIDQVACGERFTIDPETGPV